MAVLQKAIAGCSTLERLSIIKPTEELFAAEWPPPIRSVTLAMGENSFFNFAQPFFYRFSTTLESLDIDCLYIRHKIEYDGVVASLPNLRRLKIGGNPSNIFQLLHYFSTCPVIHITADVHVGFHLTLRHHSKILGILIKQYSPQLRTAQLGSHSFLRNIPCEVAEANALIQTAAEHNISLTHDPPLDVFFHVAGRPEYNRSAPKEEETRASTRCFPSSRRCLAGCERGGIRPALRDWRGQRGHFGRG